MTSRVIVCFSLHSMDFDTLYLLHEDAALHTSCGLYEPGILIDLRPKDVELRASRPFSRTQATR